MGKAMVLLLKLIVNMVMGRSSTSEKKVKAPLQLVLHLFAHPGSCW